MPTQLRANPGAMRLLDGGAMLAVHEYVTNVPLADLLDADFWRTCYADLARGSLIHCFTVAGEAGPGWYVQLLVTRRWYDQLAKRCLLEIAELARAPLPRNHSREAGETADGPAGLGIRGVDAAAARR